MIKISHRGNFGGPSSKENTKDQIQKAIDQDYDVEIDLWHSGEPGASYFLGHDAPSEEVPIDWLKQRTTRLWIHCKSPQTFIKLSGSDFNYFWHDLDLYTMTSKGFIWSRPGVLSGSNVVVLMPEYTQEPKWDYKKSDCLGVCTDFPERLRLVGN